MTDRVVVVGAGVVGLTCAVRLAEAGVPCDVMAADLPVETTSAVAGAMFMPSTQHWPQVRHWARRTLEEYLSQCDPQFGVELRDGHLLGMDSVPEWTSLLEQAPVRERPDPLRGFPDALRVRVPVIDPTRYLPWLTDRLEAAGGSLTRMSLAALPAHGTIVNATGHRARWLAQDSGLTPVRGHQVLVRNPGITDLWIHATAEDLHYVIPRSDTVLAVGGSYEPDELLGTVDPGISARVLAAATDIDPRLEGATVISTRVGFRPVRGLPRVELENSPSRRLIHCYGHGGAGWSLAWGTADEVLTLVGQERLF